jgi:cell division inhibitor SulA
MQAVSLSLEQILRRPDTWRGPGCASVSSENPSTGYPELDAVLPGRGWPAGALTEIFFDRPGIGELQLLMPAAARFTRDGRWLSLITPPCTPYPPALAAFGIDLRQVLLLDPESSREQVWACEQLLKSGQCGTVLIWLESASEYMLRRLQQTAECSTAVTVLYRPPRAQPCAVSALRLHVGKQEGRTAIHVLKRRGGTVGHSIQIDLHAPLIRRTSTSVKEHATAAVSQTPLQPAH